MWKVEVTGYDTATQLVTLYREYFNSKESAIEYCNTLKGTNTDITLEDVTSVDGNEYSRGEILIIQSAALY